LGILENLEKLLGILVRIYQNKTKKKVAIFVEVVERKKERKKERKTKMTCLLPSLESGKIDGSGIRRFAYYYMVFESVKA